MDTLFFNLRKILFSPHSKLELWARTQYHKLMATRLAFNLQNHAATISYRRWRKKQYEKPLPEITLTEHSPIVSFILSIKDSELAEVEKTVESIQQLALTRWEIITIEDTSKENLDLDESLQKYENIFRISGLSNESILQITGDYVIFCQPGDIFFEGLLNYFHQYFATSNLFEVFYYDTEIYNPEKRQYQPSFKPGKISPAQLLSTNILSRSLINAENLKTIWPLLDLKTDFEALEYEVCLRLCEMSINFKHIPSLLLQQSSQATSKAPSNANAILQHLSRVGLKNLSFENNSPLPRFTWQTNDPSIAIIIPTRNHRCYLEPLIKSIIETSGFHKISISFVDNNTTDSATHKFYRDLAQDKKINIFRYEKPFNYSDAINFGVSQTDSELILLMNDDMLVKSKLWLSELTQWAIRPEVGVVGAKLLHADNTIQHAGIIFGLSGFVGHIYLNAPEHYDGLWGSVDWYRNYLAVTGALQMMRREVFNELKGYDVGYRLAFGDIDFCLRAHEAGYQIIYTPYAQLYHYEGRTRGYQTPANDVLRGYQNFKPYLMQPDPFYSQNLTYTRIPKCQNSEDGAKERSRQIEDRISFYSSSM